MPSSVEPRPFWTADRTCLALLMVGAAIFLALLFHPAVQSAKEAAPRTQCRNNLKQIGLALHAYHDEYDSFPPAVVYDERGNPMHSWRILILPYMDEAALYEQYRRYHRSRSRGRTSYLAIAGPATAFDGDVAVSSAGIRDGSAKTLQVAEVPGEYVHWMEPRDTGPESLIQALQNEEAVDSRHSGGSHILLAHGAVRFLTSRTGSETVRALTTIAGGETVDEY